MRQSREIRKSYQAKLQSIEWLEFRQRQIELTHGDCWCCGGTRELQVHHLTYHGGEPWEYADDEVRVLCEDCHKAIHVVADDIWVELLKFQPHQLESLLKHLREPGYGNRKELIKLARELNQVMEPLTL